MFGVLVVQLMLSSAPALRVAAPGLSVVNLKGELASVLTDHLAQQLTAAGLDTLTPSQIAAALGFDRQKQLLGCADSESGSCMAELANALGSDALVLGEVTRLGSTIQVNVRLISALDAKPLANWSRQLASEEQLFEALTAAARHLAGALYLKLGRPLPAALVQSSGSLRPWSVLPAVVGVVALGVGLGFFVDSNAAAGELRPGAESGPLDSSTALELKQRGQRSQQLGGLMVAAGATAIAAAAAMFAFGGPKDLQPSAWISSHGGGLGLAGSWP